MHHIVEFHADGGQTCVPGVRCFPDRGAADRFAEHERGRKGHSCGAGSVRQRESEAPLRDEGYIYPFVASMGRGLEHGGA